MLGAYDLPPKLGTNFPLKFCKNSSDIFNHNIVNYYDYTDEMETNYYLKDPRKMENNNAY